MKKSRIMMASALLMAAGVAVMLNGREIQAAQKSRVKAVVNGSTLTISGKGAMPSEMRVKNKNRIRKIVIKKGVTSIPVGAFAGYKRLNSVKVSPTVKIIGQDAFGGIKVKKLTVPGKFKIKRRRGDDASYSVADRVDTVIFNTDLDLARTASFDARDFYVRAGDPRYKSIDGVIYSKDGKSIVRVPFRRRELTIEKGCEVFCLQSVMYAMPDAEGDPAQGCRVRKITIPSSVRKVESDHYFALSDGGISSVSPGYENVVKGLEVIVQSRQLDTSSFAELVYCLQMSVDDLVKQVPDQITYSGSMYITKDHGILKYTGKAASVTIPAGIRKIGAYAFYDNRKITRLILPEGLVEIGKESFSRCSPIFEENTLGLEISFPSTLKKIGDRAFESNVIRKLVLPPSVDTYGVGVFSSNEIEELLIPAAMEVVPEALAENNRIQKLVLPDAVKRVERNAFYGNPVRTVIFGKGITGIGDSAFYGHALTELAIPASVRTIEAEAFGGDRKAGCRYTIQGSGKKISDQAFGSMDTLVYTGPDREKKTSLRMTGVTITGKKAKIALEWSRVQGITGYEIVVSSNRKFTKNKEKIKVKAGCTAKTVAVKGKYKAGKRFYAKIRPYTRVKGRKVYGKWSVSL